MVSPRILGDLSYNTVLLLLLLSPCFARAFTTPTTTSTSTTRKTRSMTPQRYNNFNNNLQLSLSTRRFVATATSSSSSSTSSSTFPSSSENAILRFYIDMINESEPLYVPSLRKRRPTNNKGDNDDRVDDDAVVKLIVERFATSAMRDRLITPNPFQVKEMRLSATDVETLQHHRQELLGDTSSQKIQQQEGRWDPNQSSSSSSSSSPSMEGIQFTTGAVDFPGLKIDSHVICGVQQRPSSSVQDDHDNDAEWLVPPYEFNVLRATQTASGSRPMVWLFDKLAGTKSEVPATGPQSRSLTVAGIVRRRADGALMLRYQSTAQVEFQFSRRLLKLLPLGQTQTERLGSQALSRAVRKEVQDCMQACRSYLMK